MYRNIVSARSQAVGHSRSDIRGYFLVNNEDVQSCKGRRPGNDEASMKTQNKTWYETINIQT
jgi:hypothetical protein